MKRPDNEKRPNNKKPEGIPCELISSCFPKSGRYSSARDDFDSFDSWMDCQLQLLEVLFAHNVTVNSLRADFKKTR